MSQWPMQAMSTPQQQKCQDSVDSNLSDQQTLSWLKLMYFLFVKWLLSLSLSELGFNLQIGTKCNLWIFGNFIGRGFEAVDLGLKHVALITKILNGLVFFLQFSLKNWIFALEIAHIVLTFSIVWRVSVYIFVKVTLFVWIRQVKLKWFI